MGAAIVKRDEEAAAYFSGRLEGDMGLRSPLGTVLEYGTALHIDPSASSTAGPSGKALNAARVASRVEETLRLMSFEDRAVLAAALTPTGPYAPDGLRCLGDVAHVVLLFIAPADVRALVVQSRSKPVEAARVAAKRVRALQTHARDSVKKAREGYTEASIARRNHRMRERRDRWAGRS